MGKHTTRAFRDADNRFGIRVKVRVPDGGLGERSNALHEWLEGRLGQDGHYVTPVTWTGHMHSFAVHFDDATAFGPLMHWLGDHGLAEGWSTMIPVYRTAAG
jgi:hypothetical protein